MEEIDLKTFSLASASSEYDVFLSFSGEDTRNIFVSHLYEALKVKGICIFKDDKALEKRESSVSSSLLKAIEKSKISIVVLSRSYLFSSWCLDELVNIVECMKTKQQIVVPIFYEVDPREVIEQIGTVAKAFVRHQEKFADDELQIWRDALCTTATIAGWNSRKCFDGNEADLIHHIVKDISDKLICRMSSCESPLVGISSHMRIVNKILGMECNDVRMIGIWGVGGVGKTTIADVIYTRDFRRYEACCFLKNIKDKYRKDGAIALQKKLIFQTILEPNLSSRDEDLSRDVICRRLQSKKVLIVLDEIDELDQLKNLADDSRCFGQGSRIIITTRDKRLLTTHGVKYIYEVPHLNKYEALQLFSLHAFKESQPRKDFLGLSNYLVSYTHGVPLAVKVLGSSLYGRSMFFWQSEIEKLKRSPEVNISQLMRISYEVLDEIEKALFLDIAFFFNGESQVMVKNALGPNYSQAAFTTLKEKGLYTISFDRTRKLDLIEMHELIIMMAHEIVREESKKDRSSLSRPCDPKDLYEVSKNLKALQNLERIGLTSLSPQYLVKLKLENSNVEELWKGQQDFVNLRLIEIRRTKLTRLPDLSRAIKLEEMILQGCINLKDVSSIQSLANLKHLTLKVCKNLQSVPCMTSLEFLETLTLSRCSSLVELPELSSSIESLSLIGLAIDELPASIGSISNLVVLDLRNCKRLKRLPSSICQLEHLESINVSGCSILLLCVSEM